ncbi:hypothetical protein Tco_0895330 [Tanacetum coccineum]|uniref:Uncharacterized protein n=1 Tax=Tanacetum coccineum TaxID=301880 RepID=A0ABQ5CHJ5_9ASTR
MKKEMRMISKDGTISEFSRYTSSNDEDEEEDEEEEEEEDEEENEEEEEKEESEKKRSKEALLALDPWSPMIMWDLIKNQGAGLKIGERLMDLEHSFSSYK